MLPSKLTTGQDFSCLRAKLGYGYSARENVDTCANRVRIESIVFKSCDPGIDEA